MPAKFFSQLAVALLCVALVACGGGGGSSRKNSPPVADSQPQAAADSLTVNEDSGATAIDVLANDSFGGDGAGGSALEIAAAPEHGTAAVDDGGTPSDPGDDRIGYTPAADFNGADSFRYRIADKDGDTAEATVTVTVNPVADIDNAAVAASGKIKTLQFSWSVDSPPHHWRLEVNNGGGFGSALDDIPGDSTGVELELALHLTDFATAGYQLVALDEAGEELDRSSELAIADITLEQLVGYFKASNTDAGDLFGYSAALSGDGRTLAIGAPYEASGVPGNQADNAAAYAGAVYLFAKGENGWSQRLYLKAPDAAGSQIFGVSLALSGDGGLLAVAAPGRSTAVSNGAVYLFARSGEAWTQADDQVDELLQAPDTDQGDSFGRGLALSADGNTLVVGAPYNSAMAANSGAVFIYSRTDGGWDATGGPWPGAGDGYGTSLALSADGSVLAVGIPYEDSNGTFGDDSLADSGAVYLASRDADGIWSTSYVKAPVPAAGESFGGRVGLSAAGNLLAVAAPFANGDTGAVYLLNNSGGSWQQQARLSASNASSGSIFGLDLALSADGRTLVTAASLEDSAALDSGMVYVFAGGDSGWAETRRIKAGNAGESDQFGFALALSADGQTLATSAPAEDSAATGIGSDRADDSAENAGAVHLY